MAETADLAREPRRLQEGSSRRAFDTPRELVISERVLSRVVGSIRRSRNIPELWPLIRVEGLDLSRVRDSSIAAGGFEFTVPSDSLQDQHVLRANEPARRSSLRHLERSHETWTGVAEVV